MLGEDCDLAIHQISRLFASMTVAYDLWLMGTFVVCFDE